MSRHTYTQYEKEFIIKFYASNGGDYCSKHLNIPPKKIKKIANYWGLILNKDLKIQLQKDAYYRRYKNKDVNLANDLFTSWPDFWVYLLGYIWADGCLEKDSYRINLKIAVEDGKHVERMLQNSNIKNIMTTRLISKAKESWKDTLEIRITDKNIHQKLCEFGYNMKSTVSPIILDVLPETKKSLWFLGYFDGDGSIHKSNSKSNPQDDIYPTIICLHSTYDYDWTLIERDINNNDIKGKVSRYKNKLGQGSSTYTINRINDVVKFINFIYSGSNTLYALSRKFEIAQRTSSLRVQHIPNNHLKQCKNIILA
jgi:hypothetical protein